MRRWLWLLCLLVAAPAWAQTTPDPRILGTIDAAESVTIDNLPSGRGTASISIVDYCTCTLVIEGRVGATWNAIDGAPTIDADGVYTVTAAGLDGIRVRASAYDSGTMGVGIRVSSAGGGSGGGGGGAAGSVTISQGGNDAVVNGTGELTVSCGDCSGTGVSAVDDAAFTVASDSLAPVGGLFDDTLPDSVNEGDTGLFRMSANRNLFTQIRDAAGNERGVNVDASNRLTVAANLFDSGADDLTEDAADALRATLVDATGTAIPLSAEYTEDAAAAANPSGPTPILVRADTPAGVASADGDNVAQRATNFGAAFVQVVDSSGNFVDAFGGAGGTASNFGSATPAAGTAAGFTDGTNMRPGTVVDADTSGGTFWSQTVNLVSRTSGTPEEVGTTANPLVVEAAVSNIFVDGAAVDESNPAPVCLVANGACAEPTEDVEEDVASTGGEAGPGVLNVRRDAAASSSGASGDWSTFNTDALGLLWARFLDPCSGVAKTPIPVNISTATTTELTSALAGASNHYYVCALNLVTAGAGNVALVDDDSDNCASVTSGLAGGTTAASGWNLAANGGIAFGNGQGTIFRTNGTNRVLCLVTGAATQLSGSIMVVAAP